MSEWPVSPLGLVQWDRGIYWISLMWQQFISVIQWTSEFIVVPLGLIQWTSEFIPTRSCSVGLMNSPKIQWNHLMSKDAFCCHVLWSHEIYLLDSNSNIPLSHLIHRHLPFWTSSCPTTLLCVPCFLIMLLLCSKSVQDKFQIEILRILPKNGKYSRTCLN
jgi:hypothetical protein